MSELHETVGRYRTARLSAEAAVKAAFPVGAKVEISQASGKIIGVVHTYTVGVPDEIACLLENGNVWSYPVEKLTLAIRGADIPKTGHHDAGAIARCSYCGRYSDNPKALRYDPRTESPKDLRCDCGKTHGWCGSFKRPTAESVWSE